MNRDREWTVADIRTIRRMWAAGKAGSEIARRLNRSKNSVIGKVRRLRLASRPSPIVRAVRVVPVMREGGAGPLPAGHPVTWGAIMDGARWPL